MGRHVVAKVNPARQNAPYGFQKSLASRALHEVSVAARAQHTFRVGSLVVDGNHENRNSGTKRLDLLDQFQAVFARHGEVCQDEVRFQVPCCLEGALRVIHLPADFEIWLLADELSKAVTHDRMIIHDKNPPGASGWIGCLMDLHRSGREVYESLEEVFKAVFVPT